MLYAEKMKLQSLLIILLSFFASCSYLPEEVVLDSDIVLEETPNYIALSPKNAVPQATGILFYPGGLVDPHAYIEAFQELVSADNRQVVILKVSANLAITNTNKAYRCKDDFEEVQNWIIGGHSLGGVVACMDAANHREAYKGLFLLGAYSASDLNDWSAPVLLMTAELDGLTDIEKVIENEVKLPPRIDIANLSDFPITSTAGQTIYHEIPGGNHSQFGAYGAQEGDGVANISLEQQQGEVRDFLRAFMAANDL